MVMFLGFISFSHAQSEAYVAKVEKMMKLNGAKKSFMLVINQMIGQYKNIIKDAPEGFWDRFQEEIKESSSKDLAQILAPVYFKYLNENELDDILAFYNSPTGKKLAKHTPDITQESMTVGKAWGVELGKRIMDRLHEEKGK